MIRHLFPYPHVSMAEVLEREDLQRRRDSGVIMARDRIRLTVLKRRAHPPLYPYKPIPGEVA